MRLSIDKRARVISIFLQHDLNFKPGRFHILKSLAGVEGIKASYNTIRRVVKHWQRFGKILRFIISIRWI